MKALVVYYSQFGNTQRVAEAIADALVPEGTAHTISMEQLTSSNLADVDLVVMGTPTHRMNLPEAVRPVMKGLPKTVLRGVSTAAFDTSYKMSSLLSRFTASKRLNRTLRRLGGRPIASPEIFHVEGSEGPLYDGEIERAKAWAESIIARLDSGRRS